MDQIIKHGVQLAVGMNPESQKEMRATLKRIFSEAGSSIDFDTPENKKDIMALASVFRDMFESVGNKKIDFAKIMGLQSGKDMFEALKGSVNEMADVWANVVKRMGANSLNSIFMKDQSAIDDALSRLSKSKVETNRFIKNAKAAFETEKSTNIKDLLKEAAKSKVEFGEATSWEKREVAALRYLNVYRQIMNVTKDGTNVDRLSDSETAIFKDLGRLGPYVTQQLEESKAYIQASVQNIFNLADGKSLIGLTDGGAVNFDVAPRLIQTLDVGDVLGGKKNIVVPIVPEIDSAFKESLDKLRRLYKENTQEAYEESEALIEQMVSGLHGRFKDVAMRKLVDFSETDDGDITDEAYQDIYGRFVRYGLPFGYGVGTGTGTGTDTGTGDGSGTGSGTGDGTGTGSGDASSAETESLRKQLKDKDAEIAEANRKREEAELAERAAQEEASAERHATEAAEQRAAEYVADLHRAQQENAELRDQLAKQRSDVGYGVGDRTEEDIENARKIADATKMIEGAYKELDGLSADPWEIKNEEEVNRIFEERLAIIQRVGEENLKAYNADKYSDVEYINEQYNRVLDSIAETKDDEIYNNLDENFGYDNEIIESSQTLEVLLAKRRELMKDITFDAEQEFLEQEEINKAIENRIALMKKYEPLVDNGSITQDQLEEMVFEQGTIEERRSILEGLLTDQFGNEPEDIDEAQALFDQYEKIMVTTGSGKKLTLGPEMTPEDWEKFTRCEIDAIKQIEFVRKEIQKFPDNIDDKPVGGAGTGAGTGTGTGTGQTGGVTSEEVQNLAKVKEAVEAITAAVKLKTEEFKNEGTEVENTVKSEIEHLSKLEDKISDVKTKLEGLLSNIKDGNDGIGTGLSNITVTVNYPQEPEHKDVQINETSLKQALSEVVYNVKIANEPNDKDANKIGIDEPALERTLEKVFTDILHPAAQPDVKDAPWATENTLNTTIKDVLNKIAKNTASLNGIEIQGITQQGASSQNGSGGNSDTTATGPRTTKMSAKYKDGETVPFKRVETRSEKTSKSYRITKRHTRPLIDDQGNEIGEDVDLIEIIDDYDKIRKENDKTEKAVARAEKKVGEFIAKLQSKTGGNAQYVEGFADLGNMKIDADNIDKAYNKMIEIQKNYAQLEANFRKGQSSLNPFVNAINKAQNIDNIFGEVDEKFSNLVVRSDELNRNFAEMQELSNKIKYFTAKMNDPKKAKKIKFADFEKFSKDVGKFTELKTKVDGLIRSESKDNKTLIKDYEELGKLRAKFEGSGDLRDKEEFDIVNDKIEQQIKSLKLTDSEIKLLKEKSDIVYQEEMRRINAAKKQADIDKANADAAKAKKKQDKADAAARKQKENEYAAKQKALIKEYTDLSKQLGELEAKINSGLFDDAVIVQAKHDREYVVSRLEEVMDLIDDPNAVFANATDSNLEGYYSTEGAQRGKRIKELMSKVDNLGALRAQSENAGSLSERERYEVLLKESQAELDSLNLSKEHKDELLEILKARHDNAYLAEKEKINIEEKNVLYKEFLGLVKQVGAIDGAINSGGMSDIDKQAAQLEKDRLTGRIDDIRDKLNLSRDDLIESAGKSLMGEEKGEVSQRQKSLKELAKQYKNLGIWSARAEQEKTQEAKTRVAQLKEEIEAKIKSLQLTQEELDALGGIAVLANKQITESIKAKQKDKIDRAAKKKQAMTGKAGSAIGRAQDVLINAVGLNEESDTPIPASFNKQIAGYGKNIDKLIEKHSEISQSKVVTKRQQNDLLRQTKIVREQTESIGSLVSEYQKLSGDNIKQDWSRATELDFNNKNLSVDVYKTKMEEYVREVTKGGGKIKHFDAATKTLTYTVKTGAHEFTEYTAAVRNLDHQLVSVRGTTTKTETFFEATARKMKELTSYFSGMMIFNFAKQEFMRGIQYVREIDLALTELKKVTDETDEAYDRFLKDAAKTGAKLGSTISAVTEATATFAKLGYTMEQSSEMAEAAIVYKNVGDNIASTEDAADSIISTLKGFGLKASESMEIVDRFNEVGNKFAITSQGIGEALRLSASALNEGGNSLDESIAMITAANEVVNDPSSVGTALKTKNCLCV